MKRSHVDKTLVLLKIENRYVPIVETAIKLVADDKSEEVEEEMSEKPDNNAAGAKEEATDADDKNRPGAEIQDPLNAMGSATDKKTESTCDTTNENTDNDNDTANDS